MPPRPQERRQFHLRDLSGSEAILLDCREQAMVTLKSRREMDIMRDAGRIVAEVLLILREHCRAGSQDPRPGPHRRRRDHQEKRAPGLQGVPRISRQPVCLRQPGGGARHSGEPRARWKGDIVGLDFGVLYNGYYGDAAITVPIGRISRLKFRNCCA